MVTRPFGTTDCVWRGQDARLLLHFESGFELVLAGADHDAGAGHDDGAVLWRFPFGRLRHSADDGVRLLWLDFGSDDGEMVRTKNPVKPSNTQ